MRDKFFKWLKRFFIVLPIIILLLNLSIFLLRQNGENLGIQEQETALRNDFIGSYIYNGFNANYTQTSLNGYNPLFIFDAYYDGEIQALREGTVMYNVNVAIERVITILVGDSTYDTTSVYVPLVKNFLTWWVFVELIFLFFRFVTFLISWVNSLFDRCFNKINKG